MRWVEHVEHMWEGRGACRVLVRKTEGVRNHLENLGVDVTIILKWILEKWAG